MMHLAYDGDARIHENPLLARYRRGHRVAHHAYDWCTWRKSAIGHLCSRIWPHVRTSTLAAGEGILESLTSHITLAHGHTRVGLGLC